VVTVATGDERRQLAMGGGHRASSKVSAKERRQIWEGLVEY